MSCSARLGQRAGGGIGSTTSNPHPALMTAVVSAVATRRCTWRATRARTAIVDAEGRTANVVRLFDRDTARQAGLRARADLDVRDYQVKKGVSEDQLERVRIKRHRFRGDWNYTVRPTKKER